MNAREKPPATWLTLTPKKKEALRLLIQAIIAVAAAWGYVEVSDHEPAPQPALTQRAGDHEPTPAPELTITVPESVEPYRLLDFSATLPGAWIPYDANDALDVRVYDGGKKGVLTGPPGPGRLTYVRVREDGTYYQETRRFMVGGRPEEPAPTPGPSDPIPQPTPATSLIVIAYESEDGNLPPYAVGAVQQLRAAGREVRQIDDDVINGLDAVPAEVKPAIEPLRAKGLPAYAILDKPGGTVIKCEKLPETTDAILEAVK